jgi:ribosomal-protein-alanine N-acetyltransferase
MEKLQYINLALASGNDNEYIIRDNIGITIGRFFIIELSRENRYCSFRVKFYRKDLEDYVLLKEAVGHLTKTLFKNMSIYKVTAFVDEEINTRAFTELGFELEGFIPNSLASGNSFKHELLFGVDKDSFQSNEKYKSLVIKGNHIELRLLNPENAQELLDYYKRNKEYLRPFEPVRDDSFFTLEVQRRDLLDNYKQYLNGRVANLGIFKEDKLIGKIRVSNIVMGVFKNAFVGYSMDKAQQGKGYMKEALNLTVSYAFEDLDLHRIEATTLVDNEKSQGVLRGCGFKEIGISEKYLYINGEWRDHKIFYRVRD